MRKTVLFLIGPMAFVCSVQAASADIMFNVSPTTIPVGGSVTISIDGAYTPIQLSGYAYLEAKYPDAGYISIAAGDFAMQA
jgi:hypothetical protein